jgi:fumarylacetoacetase
MSERVSWVPGSEDSGFGLANLPLGCGGPAGDAARPLVAIGDYALDLRRAHADGLLGDVVSQSACWSPSTNELLAGGPAVWEGLRRRLQTLLSSEERREVVERCLLERASLRMQMPVQVADFADFFSNEHHAVNSMRIARPDAEPLTENWKSLPVGYHGRSATVIPSGSAVPRPAGQILTPDGPVLGPSRGLDFELEIACIVGVGSQRGWRIATADFPGHVFGLMLMNDWSARDIQRFESQPLGPFLSKSFATSLSEWIVPLAALEACRVPGPVPDPPLLDYLKCEEPWGFDIELEVAIQSAKMRDAGMQARVVTRTNFSTMYFNGAQQLAHLTVNGARVRTGDVFGSGTVSGPERGSEGCMLELTRGGREPITLPTGEPRAWLEDGDTVTILGHTRDTAGERINFGQATGSVLPARVAVTA